MVMAAVATAFDPLPRHRVLDPYLYTGQFGVRQIPRGP